MQESSTLLSACLGQPPPTSGRVPGCLGPCLGAFGAGSAAKRAGQGDRGSLGWTDPCWRGNLASQMSPHSQTSERGRQERAAHSKVPINHKIFFSWMGERSSTSLWCLNLPQLSHRHCLSKYLQTKVCFIREPSLDSYLRSHAALKAAFLSDRKNKQASAF